MRAVLILSLLSVATLAGCLDDDSNHNLGSSVAPKLQQFEITETTYDFGIILVTDSSTPGYTYPVQVTGQKYAPIGAEKTPVILLMHGRHGTCNVGGVELIFTHVCPGTPVTTPVDSHLGYGDLASRLARGGFSVFSINANQINDRDLVGDAGAQARAELALYTLDQIAMDSTMDTSRVGIMGHSRGGEGAARFAVINAMEGEPYGIQSLIALAPTDFARHKFSVPYFSTILPYCDGDVSNLQGSWMFDDNLPNNGVSRQIVHMGANHNWYNSIWTGDDGINSQIDGCHVDDSNSVRLSNTAQSELGTKLMFDIFVHDILGGVQPELGELAIAYSRADKSIFDKSFQCKGGACEALGEIGVAARFEIHGNHSIEITPKSNTFALAIGADPTSSFTLTACQGSNCESRLISPHVGAETGRTIMSDEIFDNFNAGTVELEFAGEGILQYSLLRDYSSSSPR